MKKIARFNRPQKRNKKQDPSNNSNREKDALFMK